jgi:hypothetical protein
LREFAELGQVIFRYPQLNRFESAGLFDGFGYFSNAARGCFGDRENCRGLAFGFVDLLLFVTFRGFDRLLLFTFGAVDRSVSLAL